MENTEWALNGAVKAQRPVAVLVTAGTVEIKQLWAGDQTVSIFLTSRAACEAVILALQANASRIA